MGEVEEFEQGDLFSGTPFAPLDSSGPLAQPPEDPSPRGTFHAGNNIPKPPEARPTKKKAAAEPPPDVAPDLQPLAERMRPRTLDELTGLEKLVGKGSMLRRLVEGRQALSVIFWGPAGSGKTTLARILMEAWTLPHRYLSAVTSGIADARAVFAEAVETLREQRRPTVVFVDEIHRFNKTQQDAFLPYVESGTIILLGATTENPSFSVVSPLLSRCRVLVLPPLEPQHLRQLLERVVSDGERGLGELHLQVTEAAYEALVWGSGGDARRAINALEAAAKTRTKGSITDALVLQTLGSRMQQYERSGETAFNILSALHKSLRGSDADAAVYWLTRLIEAGEDPLVAARRMVAMAAEDIGCADPHALPLAVAALQAFQVMGSPEGDLALAEAAIYLARAPKSNACAQALWSARKAVAEQGSLPVPLHLRNAPTSMMRQLGYGKDYRYPHDFPEGQVAQQYLPDALAGQRFYVPKEDT